VHDGPNPVTIPSSKPATNRPNYNNARSSARPREQSIEPARSMVVEKLASLSQPVVNATKPQFTRDYGHHRDERLALVENLTPGPYQHQNIPEDPNFDKFEPHSSIRLSYVPPHLT
jgi:minichromosome maintenance protein 10